MDNSTVPDKTAAQVVRYLMTKELPQDLTPDQRRALLKRRGDATVKTSSDKTIELYIGNRRVVPQSYVTQVLTNIYTV